MPSVSTMILNSLIMTGEKSLNVTSFTTAENNYHLSRLNSMIDSWSNERLMVFVLSGQLFPLTASQGSYTIGLNGVFNTARPTKIVDTCYIRDTDGIDTPLEIIDSPTYNRIANKTTDGTYPHYIHYNPEYTATSTATIFFYPEPQAGLSTVISMISPLISFSTMSATLMMPPGYQQAIETNYAVMSAFGLTEISPLLIDAARKSKAAIKSTNLPAPISRLDYAVAGGMRSNILTGP